MKEDFDPDALHRLIDEALGEVSPPLTPPASSRLPFAFNDTRLLEHLAGILPKYLHQADVQVVLEDLRTHLHQGMAEVSLRMMHSVIRHCRRCPEVTPDPQLPQWNLADPDVVFVAENQTLRGNSGSYFVDALREAGFSSRHVALTGATRCPIEETRSPNTLELGNCAGYLFTELQVLLPKLIVPLGNTSAGQFVGSIKITEDHGRIFWIGPWAIMPTYNPGYVLNRELQPEFLLDLQRAYDFVYGERR